MARSLKKGPFVDHHLAKKSAKIKMKARRKNRLKHGRDVR